MTYGENLVGLDFNPSGNKDVYSVKKSYANIIDMMNENRSQTEDNELKRYYSIAITEAQTAQMWAVKALTYMTTTGMSQTRG
jgi:hypothetical protein